MDHLNFINTNNGYVALRRCMNAEYPFSSQVWKRTDDGEWKKCHYFSKDKDGELSSEFLESMFQHISRGNLPYEDWW